MVVPDPAHNDGLLNEAIRHLQAGQLSAAGQLCRQVSQAEPHNPKARYVSGLIAREAGDPQEAIRCFEEAVRLAPRNATPLWQLANTLAQTGRMDPAIACYQQLLQLVPNTEDVYNNLGLAFSAQGNLVQAEQALREAVRLKPDYAGAHYNLATVFQRQQKLDEALAAYEAALAVEPGLVQACIGMGTAFLIRGRTAQAIAHLRKAQALNPGLSETYFKLFTATFSETGPQEAMAVLESALAVAPGNQQARFHLAVLSELAGDNARARQLFGGLDRTWPEYEYYVDSWNYAREHVGRGARLHTLTTDSLRYAFGRASIEGLILEFGVWYGNSINFLAALTPEPLHGFDSFEGIPEAWSGMPAGSYSTQGRLPPVAENVTLHRGWFEDTLPGFVKTHEGPVRFINIDCDTYASTKTILDCLGGRVVPGTVLIFDEYFCYPGWREHEYRAFQEFIRDSGLGYEYLLFNLVSRQVAVLIK